MSQYEQDQRVREMIDSLRGEDEEYAAALRLNSRMFRDRIGVVATFSAWSGRKIQDPRELSSFGISDTARYLAHRSAGDKLLIPKERLSKLAAGKLEADGWLSRNFMKVSFLPGVYAVPRDQAKEVREKLLRMAAEYKQQAIDYTNSIGDWTGESPYDREREAMVEMFYQECPELGRDFFRGQYPSPQAVAAKFSAKVFLVPIFSPSVGDTELDRAQALMIAMEARELAKDVSLKLRAGIAECLQSFLSTLGGKDPDSKINQRTINSVRKFFERFRNLNFIADPAVEEAITLVENKFAGASSLTKEELVSMGIEETVSAAVTAAGNQADALRNAEEYLDSMTAEDWSPGRFVARPWEQVDTGDAYFA